MIGVRPSRRAVIVAASVAVLVLAVVGLRHVIVRTVLQTGLSVATGYRVRIGAETIGIRHATFFDVHVEKDGDPVLDARRVDVDYALRDIFPGGQHRYGFAAVAIQSPVLTITRHADGSLTFAKRGGTPAAPPAPTRAAAEPLYFTARIRDGTLRLVDVAPRVADLRVQTIEHLTLDASVKSDARTTMRLDGVLLSRTTQSAPLRPFPLAVRSVIDVPRGIALNRFTARELPMRGLLNFLVHTPAVAFAGGVLDDVDVDAYALAPKQGQPFAYTLGGGARLRDGALVVGALAKPVRDLRGPVEIAGDTVAVPRLDADAAGVPFHGRGALYDLFTEPTFRIAIAGDTDVRKLRALFAFMAKQPVSGPVHLETLLASRIAQPLIRSAIVAPRIAYERYPIESVRATVDYYADSVVMNGVEARFGSMRASLGGRILIRKGGDDLAFAVAAHGPGSTLPYADVMAPRSDVGMTVLLTEPPRAGFSARGTIALAGPTAGTGTFNVDPKGVGEFGPFEFGTAGGASIAGGFELQRPISQSAGWLHARDFPLAQAPLLASGLPGVRVPGFPPISGVLNGDFAGGGTPSAFGIAGSFSGRGMRAANFDFGSGSVRLGGSLDDLRLGSIRIAGPLGRFSGDGAFDGKTFALDGRYDGTLADLAPFTGALGSQGALHAPVRAALTGSHVVVQTGDAEMAGGTVHGVPVRRFAGTLAIEGKNIRIVAADGQLAGGRAVAADAGGPFLVSAPDLQAATLRKAGLPLAKGSLAVFGTADLRGGPHFDGTVLLAGGTAAGYPVSGGVDLQFSDATARIRRGVAALGATYGRFAGTVGGIGTSGPDALAYDLDAGVPIGEIGELARTLRLPVRYLEGSFAAQLRVRGNGSRPRLAGRVVAPEGSYNGLAFSAARATLALSPSGLRATDGTITVGSTHATVDAALSDGGRAFSVDARSADANLADFDDYFDEAETLDGRGRVAFDFADDGVTARSYGRVDLAGFRYRRFPFGATDATWSQRGRTIAAAVNVAGPHGALRANGTAIPGPGAPVAALRAASVHAAVTARAVDLATWLPAFGFHAPVLGSVSASGTVSGRWPRLALGGQASLSGGKVDGFAIRSATVHATGDVDRIRIASASADLGFATFTAAGSFGLARTDPLALSVEAQTPDLAAALAAVRPRGPRYPIGGAATGDALITGTIAKPRATVGFELTGAHYAALAIPHVLGSVAYDGKTLTVNDAEATFAKGSALLAGSLPVSLRPLGLAPNAPLSFTLALDRLDLGPFAPFVPGPAAKLGGLADGRLEIEGTARAPRVVGTAGLANAFYISELDKAGVTKANAQLTFSGTSVALDALHADVGGGTLTGSGRIDLPFPGSPQRGYAIALTAKGARIDTPLGRGSVDGSVQLESTARLPTLGGNLTLSNASIPFAALYKLAAEGGASPAGRGGPPFDLAFDLVAHAGRNVRVQSSIMDIGATGTLDLSGTVLQPRISGVLTATPGSVFSTYNRAFRVEQASVRFDPANGVDPYIDLRAYAHVDNPDPDPTRNAVGSADITILADGPADEIASGQQPLTFTSNPPYSQEQIVGLLLDASVFGAVNFGQQQNGTNLRGAPAPENPLDPPGVTTYQAGVVNFNEEAFSVLNGQLTQRFLAPVERVFTGVLNLTDLELTVDYGGGVGYQALKQIGHRDIYASFGQTLANPIRTTTGFTARPDAITSISFSYFDQNGNPAITTSPYGYGSYGNIFGTRLQGIQPLSYRQGFTLSIVRKYP